MDHEKRGKKLDAEKRLEAHIVQFINTEETSKEATWKNSSWGFLGRQKMCLRIKNELKDDKCKLDKFQKLFSIRNKKKFKYYALI